MKETLNPRPSIARFAAACGALGQDARFGLRMLRKSPGFTAVAMLSLALGIGANTALFSALNAVRLRSLPVPDPHRLRLVHWTGLNPQLGAYTGPGTSGAPGGFRVGTSFPYPVYRELRDRGAGFTDVFAFAPKRVTATARGEASSAVAMLVSGNYFAGYGVNPRWGRLIAPEDDRSDAAPVAVVTHRWWDRFGGGDTAALGQSILLNRVAYTIVGVLPREYAGPTMGDSADIYVPLSAQPRIMPDFPLASLQHWWVQVMGRLAPKASETQAQTALSVAFQQTLGPASPALGQPGVVLEDGRRGQMLLRRQFAKPLLALTAVVALVLLVACANLAGLLLARGAARRQELAVRAALGASRWQLLRQSLVESLLLALLGASLGLAVAAWLKHLLAGFFLTAPDSFHFDLRTDGNVLAFTLAVSVLAALVFGLLPACRAARVDPASGLAQRATLTAARCGWGRVLVVVQVSLSVLLVLGAGLMIRTFANLTRVTPGFDPTNVLLFRVRPSQAGYPEAQWTQVYDRLRQALVALPGVRSVTLSSFPLVSDSSSSFDLEFPGRENGVGARHPVDHLAVGEDFFRTLNIPLLLGRDFSVADTAATPLVAVVNETFVRRFLPGGSPLGRSFLVREGAGREAQVVGVCRDTKYRDLRAEAAPLVYLSQRQRPQGGMCFTVRTEASPYALVPAVRRAMAAIDPGLPVSDVKTQERQIERTLAPDRVFASLSGASALLAVLLSCAGLYGLMAYQVARRTREIGLRLALGATPAQVAGPILREATRLAALGLAVGLPAALALTRLLRGRWYGVAAADPLTLVVTGLVALSVALASAWIPARRAMRVNPIEALRAE